MNRSKINKLIRDLGKVNLLNQSEVTVYIETAKSLKTEEEVILLENEIEEITSTRSTIDDDINTLVDGLLVLTRTAEASEMETSSIINGMSILKPIRIDVFRIKTGYKASFGFHPIITLEFNDKQYSFGYNSVLKSLSYSEDGGAIRWFNFPRATRSGDPDDIVRDIPSEIPGVISSILEVDFL